MLMKLAALTVVPVLLVGGAVMNASVLVVHVDSEDVSLTIPVPLALAQVAMAFVPAEAKRVEVPEFAEYAPYLERIVTAIQNSPDGLFVQVDDGDDHVRVAKEGGLLKILVNDADDEQVTVSLPLASLSRVLDAYDAEEGVFRTSRLVGALRAAPSGELVHVLDSDDEVRISIW